MSFKLSLFAAAASITLLWSEALCEASPACDGPIRLGAITTSIGPADFGEAPKAAKAYFDKIKWRGQWLQGRPLQCGWVHESLQKRLAISSTTRISSPWLVAQAYLECAVDSVSRYRPIA
jgi:hypothetical protein